MTVELRQIECFLAVVEHGGVTSAAAALHLAQPSVSQTIRGLERDLGVELFNRKGRRLTPTPAGQALVAPARRVLHDLSVARAAVDGVLDLAAGWLTVAAHDVLALEPLTSVLAAFHGRHPGVPVRLLVPRDEDHLIRLVDDGRCEVAVTYLPVRHEGLRLNQLGTQEVCAILDPRAADAPDPLPVRRLDGVPVITGMHGPEALDTAIDAAMRSAGVRLRPAVLTRHREAVIPLVLAGAGVGFASGGYADEAIRAGATVRRLDPPVRCAFGLLHRPGSLSPAARGFLSVLREESGRDLRTDPAVSGGPPRRPAEASVGPARSSAEAPAGS
jgi:DNA-binding transcriptional LysR family regulator